MQCVQDPNQNNVDHLNNIRRVASRQFKNKKKEYLRTKIDELETNSKIKNIRDLCRGISDFKKGYQPRTNIVWGEKGDIITASHRILPRCLLFSVHGVNDDRQTPIHTAGQLASEPSASEVEMAINKPKRLKSPCINQTPAELINSGAVTIRSEIYKLMNTILNKEELPDEWKESIIVRIKQTVVTADTHEFCQLRTQFYPTSCCQG